jgi:hypothetical protein
MASPTYGAVSNNFGTAASLTMTEPTGTVSGSGLICCIFSDTDPAGFTGPTGWTLQAQSLVTDGTNTFRARIYSVLRGASAPGLAVSWTGSSYFEWTIHRVAGNLATAAFFESITSATPGSGTVCDSPSNTPLTANTLAFSLAWSWAGFTGSQTQPAGYTQQLQSLNLGNACATKALSTTAPENPGAWGAGTSAALWANTVIVASQAASTAASLPIQQRAPGFPPGAPLPGIALLGKGQLAVGVPAPTLAAQAAASPTLKVQRRALGFPPSAPLPGIALLGVGLLVPTQPAAPAVDDSTGSAATSSFAASGTGTVTFDAPGSAALSPFASSGRGVFAIPAPFADAQPQAFGIPSRYPAAYPSPPPILLGSGLLFTSAFVYQGAGNAATSAFAPTASALETFDAPGSLALSPFAASGNASVSFVGTGSATLSSFASSGSGFETFDAPGSAAVGSFGIAALGVFAIPAPMPAPQPRALGYPSRVRFPAQRLGGGLLVAGGQNAALVAVSPFAVTASALVTFDANGSAAASSFAASATAAETFSATGSAALSSFANSASGSELFDAPGSAATSSFAITASGSLVIVALTPSFTAQPQPRLLGYPARSSRPAQLLRAGVLAPQDPPLPNSATVAVSHFDVAASGLVTFTGSGSAALSPFASAGVGAESYAGTGSAACSRFAASASGAETFASAVSAACSSFAATASAAQAFAGTASCARVPFGAAGSGTTAPPITGSGSAALSPFACTGALGGTVTTGPVRGTWQTAIIPTQGTWRAFTVPILGTWRKNG